MLLTSHTGKKLLGKKHGFMVFLPNHNKWGKKLLHGNKCYSPNMLNRKILSCLNLNKWSKFVFYFNFQDGVLLGPVDYDLGFPFRKEMEAVWWISRLMCIWAKKRVHLSIPNLMTIVGSYLLLACWHKSYCYLISSRWTAVHRLASSK